MAAQHQIGLVLREQRHPPLPQAGIPAALALRKRRAVEGGNRPDHRRIERRLLQLARQPCRAARTFEFRRIQQEEPDRPDVQDVVVRVRQFEQPMPERIRILRLVVVARHRLERERGQFVLQAFEKQVPAGDHAGVIRRIARIGQIPRREHEIRIRLHHARGHRLGRRDVDPALQIVVQRERERLLRVRRRCPELALRFVAVGGRNRVVVVRPRPQVPQREHVPARRRRFH